MTHPVLEGPERGTGVLQELFELFRGLAAFHHPATFARLGMSTAGTLHDLSAWSDGEQAVLRRRVRLARWPLGLGGRERPFSTTELNEDGTLCGSLQQGLATVHRPALEVSRCIWVDVDANGSVGILCADGRNGLFMASVQAICDAEDACEPHEGTLPVA